MILARDYYVSWRKPIRRFPQSLDIWMGFFVLTIAYRSNGKGPRFYLRRGSAGKGKYHE